MAKYHVNPDTGNAGICKSEHGKCPFGEGYHGDSRKAVEEIFAREMENGTNYQTRTWIEDQGRRGAVAFQSDLPEQEKIAMLKSMTVESEEIPTMSFVAKNPVDLEKINDLKTAGIGGTPVGGLWLSRSTRDGSDWVPSMAQYREKAGVVLSRQVVKPKKGAKILKIDSFEDLEKLIRLYPATSPWTWKRMADFSPELLKKAGYDGVWLTRKGWLDTRPEPPYNDFPPPGVAKKPKPEPEVIPDGHFAKANVSSDGWIPSMVLFSAEAVGELEEAETIHRDPNGRDMKLLILGQNAAAEKYSSFEEYMEDKSGKQLKELVLKLKTRKKPLSKNQREAVALLAEKAVEKGIAPADLNTSTVAVS